MTDEEKLAEEYVKSVIDVNAFDWKIVREIYLAFLEGLKAGSQLDKVWHDYDAVEDSYEDTHEGRWVKRDEVHQLSKAKEIIKMVIDSYNHKERFSFEKDLMKAEQFLKEETNGL